ncbi:MAG: YtfJ family protein [Campylobacterota bacterium]|nr:YtfJ family protein [Campylobacterota bacterium]
MKKIVISIFFLALNLSALTVGQLAPAVTLDGDNGGTVEEQAWSSKQMLQGKIHVLLYVDPDEKDTNNDLTTALKLKKFDRNYYGSVAIINLAATWMPNFAIEAKLKKKQELYPDTLYVKDKKSVLVNEWNIADDSSNVLLFNREGKLLYLFEGRLDESEISKVIQLIEDYI